MFSSSLLAFFFKKITTKGLWRFHGQRRRPDARDELVLVSIMIKGKNPKEVTCRLHVPLSCLRLGMCSQKSTKKRVEVMRELLLAIHERWEFPSILLYNKSKSGERCFLCVYGSDFVLGVGGKGLYKKPIKRLSLPPPPYKLAQLSPDACQVAPPAKSVELKL